MEIVAASQEINAIPKAHCYHAEVFSDYCLRFFLLLKQK
jgi:hypothetical protein